MFDASPSEVAAALVDPAFYEALELPDVGPAELVARHPPDGTATGDAPGAIVVRYEYTGDLDPLVRRLLRGARLTWTQELSLRRAPASAVAADPETAGPATPPAPVTSSGAASFTGSLEIHAEVNPSLLRARAEVRLDPARGGGTRRAVDGDLVVSLPGLGRMAERRIVPGVLRRLDVEAEALGRRLG